MRKNERTTAWFKSSCDVPAKWVRETRTERLRLFAVHASLDSLTVTQIRRTR